MSNGKTAKDVMIGIFEYPHVPYWFSISQAIRIAKVTFISAKKFPDPMAILVFDEKYNLMGYLTLKDILKGLEPRVTEPTADTKAAESGQALVWETLFAEGSKELAEKPISEIMTPARQFVEPEDPVTKAAYIMLHDDMVLVPVLEGKKKFVGLVRMIEVFDSVSDEILKG